MHSIRDLVNQHLEQLKVRRYSPCTIRNRRGHLGQFLRYLNACRKGKGPLQLGLDQVQGYSSWLHRHPTRHGMPRSAATLNRGLSAVRGFCRFLADHGVLASDAASLLPFAREPKRLPRGVFTVREAARMLDRIDISTPIGRRDRAALELLYSTGLRKSELIRLALDDLNLDNGLLLVRGGKGGRDRVLPVGTMARDCVRRYLLESRPFLVGPADAGVVFVSRFGHSLSESTVNLIVRRRAEQAGIRKRVTCHLWRHTCATHLVLNGANLRHVQDLLGHASLATTEKYLHLTVLELRATHRRCHPREKMIAKRRARSDNQTHAAGGSSTQRAAPASLVAAARPLAA